MLGLAARPDPWSGFLHTALAHSACDRTIGHSLLGERPECPVWEDRVEDRAEDVVLALVEGGVSDPHRSRPRVAGQLVSRGLGEVASAVDPVHDLQRTVIVRLQIGDELHELVSFPVEVQKLERLQGEGRVAIQVKR